MHTGVFSSLSKKRRVETGAKGGAGVYPYSHQEPRSEALAKKDWSSAELNEKISDAWKTCSPCMKSIYRQMTRGLYRREAGRLARGCTAFGSWAAEARSHGAIADTRAATQPTRFYGMNRRGVLYSHDSGSFLARVG
jgi:hypothetical protein